jgi:hypothetical protein
VHVVADRYCSFFPVLKASVALNATISIDVVIYCLALKFSVFVMLCSSRVVADAASHHSRSCGVISGTDG